MLLPDVRDLLISIHSKEIKCVLKKAFSDQIYLLNGSFLDPSIHSRLNFPIGHHLGAGDGELGNKTCFPDIIK